MKLSIYSLIYISVMFLLHNVNSFRMNSMVNSKIRKQSASLQMNFFTGLFGPKKTASASHILVSGENAVEVLTDLKTQINKSKDLKKAFADNAVKYSSCPSGKKGGALGTFKQGQMVPAFDKVVFSEELNKVHGPVKTPFGAHLILIDSRSD